MNDYLQFSLKHQLSIETMDPLDHKATFWFIFQNGNMVVEELTNREFAPLETIPDDITIIDDSTTYLGRYKDHNCFVAETAHEPQLSSHLSFVPLRTLLGKMDQDLFTISGRGLQILHFHHEHKFCGKCGGPMKCRETEMARFCSACDHTCFPRVSPAVIMSVIDGDRILLGRSHHFPTGMYSTLAGFVEPGETLEETVKREVFEEVQLRVANIQYVASQPWPFPHSMMIGFSADYKSGDIVTDKMELEDANWYRRDNLPTLPREGTIARYLIDTFIKI